MVARRYLVRGVVQGVGFRYFTQRAAREAGVCGFVRNLAEEGDPQAVERLERAIRSGPPLARVEAVEAVPRKPPGGFSRFEIRA